MDKVKNATMFLRHSLTISCEGLLQNFDEALSSACKCLDIEYIGERIEKSRNKVTLVKCKNQLYSLCSASACQSELHFYFKEYSECLEETQPLSDYLYVIEYCNPSVDSRFSMRWYYKASELNEAKKMQEVLSPRFALLYPI